MNINSRLLILAALLAVLLAPGLCRAQATAEPIVDAPLEVLQRNTPVAVEYEGNDSIGARLCTRIKEMLNSSNLFVLDESDTPKFRILLSTVSEFETRPGVGSAYSVTWVFSLSEATLRHYLSREVGVLTADQVDDTAAKIIERTDSMAVRYNYLFPQ